MAAAKINTIAKYKVIERIGQGGMGEILKATHLEHPERIAAIKLSDPLDSVEAIDLKRFYEEAAFLQRLDHPNIVSYYDYGLYNEERPYIVMQHIEGKPFSKFNFKDMELGDIIHFGGQVLQGLEYIHNNNIIHRDIKPSNLLIDRFNKLYISDFGISKDITSNESLTQTGTAVGTPEYMSPEQCEGNDISGATDIYSTGILFYEMLTGKPPFTGQKPMAVAYKQVHDTPKSIVELRPDIAESFQKFVLKALEKEPKKRFKNATEMLSALKIIETEIEPPTIEDEKERKWNKAFTEPSKILKNQALKNPILISIFVLTIILCVSLTSLFTLSSDSTGLGFQKFEVQDHTGIAIAKPNFDTPLTLAALPNEKSKQLVFSISYKEKMLVHSISIAVRPQANQSNPNRFRPKKLTIKNENNQQFVIDIKPEKGIQHYNIFPFEAKKIRLYWNTNRAKGQNSRLQIFDIKTLGIPCCDS